MRVCVKLNIDDEHIDSYGGEVSEEDAVSAGNDSVPTDNSRATARYDDALYRELEVAVDKYLS